MNFTTFALTIQENIAKVIIGKQEAVELLLVALLCDGNVLLEDVPGIGKTTLAKALARCIDCSLARIQFTPDLLPSDVTGINYFNQKSQNFEFRPGPVFSQLLLGDEINRATPRTQSSLLEAMQERQITVDVETMALPRPFLVLATQNPVELEGTFPLPEAQLDRFLLQVQLGYPSLDEEEEILMRYERQDPLETLEAVTTGEEIVALQKMVREVPIADDLIRYALAIVRQTRVDQPGVPDFVRDSVAWGAGPRAVQFLILGAKARALLDGRTHVSQRDLAALAQPVLRHRLVLNFTAESEGVTADSVIARILDETPTNHDELTSDARFQAIFAS